MSARDIILPESALKDMLQEIDTNITAIERRVSWPGAVRSAVGGVVGPIVTGNWPSPTTSNTALLSFAIDPGRWILFSNTSMAIKSTSGSDYPPGGRIHTGIGVASAVAPTVRGGVGAALSTGTSGSREAAMTDVVQVHGVAPMTVTLSAGGNYNLTGYVGLTGTYTISSSILIAFPG